MIYFFIDILLLFIQLISPPQEEPEEQIDQEVLSKLASYSWSFPQEKVYLHTDKDFYTQGEDIWFKGYLMIGPYHIPDTLSTVVYVELIESDETLIDRRILHMRRGLGWGDFNLPASILPGEYIIKAYTQYMRNFDPGFHYRKSIQILPSKEQDPSSQKSSKSRELRSAEESDQKPVQIQFFPEGGHMIDGLQNYVALKAIDLQGKGVNVHGVITGADGGVVTKFESKKFGLGLFSIKPVNGEDYVARVSIEGKEYLYELPKPLERGYAMHIIKKGENVSISVRNNMGVSMNNSFVIGQFRGFPFVNVHAKRDQDYIYSVLNIKEIPSGIIQFTFFDSLGIPQCERLVYTENEKDRLNFSVESNKSIYGKREKASFHIHCEDLDNNIILTNLSLSISNNAIVPRDDADSHIRSYFFLESDLKGQIEDPGYYFNPKNEDRFEMLDMLLLTHGWRRFVWKEILEDHVPVMEFPPEIGFSINGELVDFYNQSKSKPGNVRLFIYEGQFYYNEIETDKQGFFQFPGIDIYDSTDIVIQAWRLTDSERKQKKNRPPETKNDYTIKIHDQSFPGINSEYWPILTSREESHQDYLELNELILKIDSSFEGRTILMDELLIEDKAISIDEPFDRPGKLHKTSARRIVMDSLPDGYYAIPLFDIIQQQYPSVRVSGVPPNLQISIRGSRSISGDNSALVLLDGTPVENDFIYYFPPSEIAFIDVLTSSQAALYGRQASNGAIALFTRREPVPYVEEGRMGMHNFVHPGYYRAREFYTPDYDTPDEKHIKPDFRRILYWNPSLTTDDNGNIVFSFFTSDEAAEYRVEIEGMSYSGIPLTCDYYFSVE